MPKSHTNDVLAIALGRDRGGVNSLCNIDRAPVHIIVAKLHHNRQLHKMTILRGGIRKQNQAAKYVFRFQLYDKVLLKDSNQTGFIFGRRSSGYFDVDMLMAQRLAL